MSVDLPISTRNIFNVDLSIFMLKIFIFLFFHGPKKNKIYFSELSFSPDCSEKPLIQSISVYIYSIFFRKHEQSSANCFSLCSEAPILIPLTFGLFLILVPIISTHNINRMQERGQPCLTPLPSLNQLVVYPLLLIQL